MNNGFDRTRDYLDRFWTNVVDGLPEVLGALLLLLIGYFVAKALAKLDDDRASIRLNRIIEALPAGMAQIVRATADESIKHEIQEQK